MGAVSLRRSAIILVGFAWAGMMMGIAVHRASAAGGALAASPESGSADNTPAPTGNTAVRVDPGVWRHFGGSQSAVTPPQNSAPLASPRLTGVWHHFGENAAPPAPIRTADPRRASSVPASPRTVAGASPEPASSPTRSVPLETYRPIPERPELLHPVNANLSDLEQQMCAMVNNHRADPENRAETGGMAQNLRWNEQLAAVARAHSENMLKERFFNHVDPEGRSPADRVTAAGIGWHMSGENIALADSIITAENAFMNEPRFEHNHRANILNSKYTDIGIGIVQGSDGRYYITQEFIATPAGR